MILIDLISDCGGSDDEGGRGEPRASGSGSSGMSKKERFFWQYNVQAKGPKGQKISLTPETVDPHVLNEVQDPVFSPYCSVDGIKHRFLKFHACFPNTDSIRWIQGYFYEFKLYSI
jgi:hypothetical protein